MTCSHIGHIEGTVTIRSQSTVNRRHNEMPNGETTMSILKSDAQRTAQNCQLSKQYGAIGPAAVLAAVLATKKVAKPVKTKAA